MAKQSEAVQTVKQQKEMMLAQVRRDQFNELMDYAVHTICDGIITGGFKTVRGNLLCVLQQYAQWERDHPKVPS